MSAEEKSDVDDDSGDNFEELLTKHQIEELEMLHSSAFFGEEKVRNGQIPSGKTPEEEASLIISALNNNNYNARTIGGIAKESGLLYCQVVNSIRNNRELHNTIKVYPRRTQKGSLLLTTKNRFSVEATIKNKFIDVFSTKRLGINDVN